MAYLRQIVEKAGTFDFRNNLEIFTQTSKNVLTEYYIG